jgi:hypothetical protein
MRELLSTHKDILIKLEQMEKKMIKQGGKLQKHDQDIRRKSQGRALVSEERTTKTDQQ